MTFTTIVRRLRDMALLSVVATGMGVDAIAQTNYAGLSRSTAVGEAPLLPGDKIELYFGREPHLNGEYPVEENGIVQFPILGPRDVTTIAPSVLQQQLKEDYARYLANQIIRVTLLRRVRILGAVQQPGLYYVNPTMTLGDALALASGATPRGKLSDIRIVRRQNEVQSGLDLNTLIAQQVESGDQILVPERSWIARHSPYLIGGLLSITAAVIWRSR